MTMARASSELTDLCPYRVCINLDRRPERWKRMDSRFSEFGLLPVERFSAVDGLKMPIPVNWPESPGAWRPCPVCAYSILPEAPSVFSAANRKSRENRSDEHIAG